ncbi:T9SS type A sorting domain-containing protein [Seonamhaeicola aphaedonensis]|uniref:Putative secreted protein (Por secretion system target) n=1 Tax=Seonamhaeicola aphaedonensis TaxID=1461338 RepID=A0A3D9HEW8_9FLAO|nr:T9SS type A sorting domain-containing protein [Seonamhaeicola aphaedonensis]RED47791.1 putative secreted protein (Por secretion system target) [Seonamhaeicola aphaedonensis]
MKKIFINTRLSSLLFIFGCALLSQGQVRESSLWGPNGINWDPAGRLPDFSYAGYKSSNESIPNVPVVANLTTTGAMPDDELDDTAALQSLINQQATLSRNQRGAIFIPKGRWVIDNQLELNVSGVVLRGEVDSNGRPLTTFYFPNGTPSLTSYHIRMLGKFETTNIGNVSANVAQGVNEFNVAGGSSLNVGDFVQLEQQDPADDSFSSYLHGNLDAIGPSTKDLFIHPRIFYWYAYVTAVNGNTITFDRPLPIELRTEWSPFIRKMNMDTTTSEMGIENISFVCNNNVAFVHNDYIGFRIMELNEVINCWVKNVELIDLEYGIRIHRKSAHNTVSGVLIQDVQRSVSLPPVEPKSTFINRMKQQAGGGHHPLEVFQGFYNLFEDFEFKEVHWHELSVEGVAAFNVFRSGKGVAMAFDNHRNAPYANLWTNIDIGRPERLWFNSGSNQPGVAGRERGPNAGFRTTYWNITYENVVPDIEIEPASTDGFAFLNYIGVEGARKQNEPIDKVNSQLVEVAGVGESIAQPDLFLAQLERRSSPTIPNNFTIQIVGETCVDKKNGSITINALIGRNYVVTINGQTINFTKTATIENLNPGVYDFCITIEGDIYNRCYQATIESAPNLTGKINVDKKRAAITITKGTAPYTVLKNGVAVLETNNKSFAIDIQHGDDLQITGKAACQGKLEKHINLLENLKAYPNPSSGEFEMFMPENLKYIHLEVYNIQSQAILSKIYQVNNGVVRLNISDKPNGIYFIKVNAEKPSFLKVIKK